MNGFCIVFQDNVQSTFVKFIITDLDAHARVGGGLCRMVCAETLRRLTGIIPGQIEYKLRQHRVTLWSQPSVTVSRLQVGSLSLTHRPLYDAPPPGDAEALCRPHWKVNN